MKLFIYSLLINLFLLVYLLLNINSQELLFPICIIFNILNIIIILIKPTKSSSKNNLSKTFNIIINFSILIFMYPDLLFSDPYLDLYGEKYYIVKAFKLILLHQSIITLTLKFFEFKKIGDIELNNINFFNKNLIKIILNLNFIGLILYFLNGNNINNFISGRNKNLYGSFFKIEHFSGGYASFFHIFNYFVQFSVVLGLVYLFNILITKMTKDSLKIKGDKIRIFEKYLILFYTLSFLISAYFSDVRINLMLVFIPTSLLFFYLGKYKSKSILLNRIKTNNSSKIILILILILSFLIISEIQVYRRGNISFFEKDSYSFTKNTGIVQTDKSLYNLSQIIKLTPKNGSAKGKEIIKNIPYNFIPSLIAPNKPTRVNTSVLTDIENSIFNNFNDLRTNKSISITYLGDFIYAFGVNRGFLLSILSMVTIVYLCITMLIKTSTSFLFPYIYVTTISFTFLLCRSINHFSNEFALFIYSTLILYFFYSLRMNIKKRKSSL